MTIADATLLNVRETHHDVVGSIITFNKYINVYVTNNIDTMLSVFVPHHVSITNIPTAKVIIIDEARNRYIFPPITNFLLNAKNSNINISAIAEPAMIHHCILQLIFGSLTINQTVKDPNFINEFHSIVFCIASRPYSPNFQYLVVVMYESINTNMIAHTM